MNAQPKSTAGKKSAKQDQHEANLAQGRKMAGKLPTLVAPLYAGQIQRDRKLDLARATTTTWNDFNARHGSFADEYQ